MNEKKIVFDGTLIIYKKRISLKLFHETPLETKYLINSFGFDDNFWLNFSGLNWKDFELPPTTYSEMSNPRSEIVSYKNYLHKLKK